MLRIGRFAHLAGVSVKTVRFYSNLGLLRPAAVDPSTGYRAYDAGQILVLRRIEALKELGFGLREIRVILAEPASLGARLRGQRDRLAAEIGAASLRLARLDRLLADPQPFAVTVRRSRSFHAWGLRDGLGAYEDIDALFDEASRRLPRGVRVRGRVAAWHAEGSTPGRIQAEALFVLDGHRAGALAFPSRDVASVVYHGDRWEEPYARLAAWLAEHGCVLAGPKLEHLLPDGLVELQFPFRREPSA